MSTFRVRASSLGEVSAQLQGVLAVFDAHVAEVAGKVSAVSGTSWEGADQAAFAEKWTQWQQTSDLVRLSLTSLATQLAMAEGAYTATESKLQGDMSQRRQANTQLTDMSVEVDESVDTGLERARSRPAAAEGSGPIAAMTARSGQGSQQTGPVKARAAEAPNE